MKPLQFLTIVVISCFFSQPATAYLDPGTGSLILQMLIAGIIGAMFTIKMYWYRLKEFIARLFGTEKKTDQDNQDDNNQD